MKQSVEERDEIQTEIKLLKQCLEANPNDQFTQKKMKRKMANL